ncbi:cytosolic thiouridylase subunit 2 isoform X2 [Lycorma delicatula]|uniref:cytosolic thiouridylase subunit 2 isoform X2 n=1 Tax=Lycorma delicatula TaxID=130591 RepID=UPI003F517A3A
MCTVNYEDGDINLMQEKQVLNLIGSNCKKCSDNVAEVVLRGKDAYCRTCFLQYATHKFRASLGKSKMVHKGDKVLVGFSGSASSLALLHLIKAGFEEEAHKKLVFEPFIVYIDEGAAFNRSIENRRSVLRKITDILKRFNFNSYTANIECIFYTNDKTYYDLNIELPITSDSELYNMFSKIKCPTSKEDILIKLRNNFLLKIASDLGCNKILTAETLVNTASKLLSNISLGRGAQLPFDIGFCDSRDKIIKILRPMQDFGSEEIEFYNSVYELKPVNIPSWSEEADGTSIQILTRRFVDELQENFPATISTVYRTGAKLNIEKDAAESVKNCSLCKGPLDTSVVESSSLQATMYSSLISKCGPEDNNPNGEKKSNADPVCCNGERKKCNCDTASDRIVISKSEAMNSLCYGCRLITKDLLLLMQSEPANQLWCARQLHAAHK